MFTVEELKKDLEAYQAKQLEMREQYSNLTGAIHLLTMQIDKLEAEQAKEAEEKAAEVVELD